MALHQACQAYLMSSLTYALPSWWGFLTNTQKQQLQALQNKAHRWGLDGGIPIDTIDMVASNMDSRLFQKIIANENHVLFHLLPPLRPIAYSLRPRPHNHIIPRCSKLQEKSFIHRMLNKDSY